MLIISSSMLWHQLNTIDFVLLFLAGILIIIISSPLLAPYLGMQKLSLKKPISPIQPKKSISTLEYLLMGRRLTMPFFVMTLVSTWYGNIFGVTQIAFEHGIYNFITQGLFWYLAYIVFAFYFAKKIHDMKVYSISEMISQLFGAKSARLTAVLLFIKTLPISYAIGLGLFLKTMFAIPLNYSIFTSCLLVAVLGSFGGFRGVVVRDIIQFCLMYIGVLSVLICSIYKFGGLSFLQTNLPKSYFSIHGQHDYKTTFLWLFVAFSSTLVSPVFYQRCLAAKDGKTAQIGVLISTCFWFIFDIGTTLGGMYAKAAMPHLESLNGYLIFGLEILPHGLKGLFIAGIIATILSTLDAFTFSSSTLLSYDICNTWFQNKRFQNKQGVLRIIATFITSIITCIVALTFDGYIENVWLILELYAGVAIMMPIIWKRIFSQSIIKDWQYIVCCSLSIGIISLTHSFISISSFYLASLSVIICLFIFSYQNSSSQKIDQA